MKHSIPALRRFDGGTIVNTSSASRKIAAAQDFH
jgi:hypothetical protein